MRLRRLPRGFYRLARSSLLDLPASARSRLELVALIERLRGEGVKVALACRLVGVPRASYYRWRARLASGGALALRDGRAGARRRRLAPVRASLRPLIEQLRRCYQLGKEKLRVLLARRGVHVSASSIQRVLGELFARGVLQRVGYAGRSRGRQRRAAKRAHAQRKRSGQRPQAAGELIQLDTLHEHSQAGRPRYQFTAVDPTTRWLHAGLYARASSANAADFLSDLNRALPFSISSIQVDNGSEYKGAFEAACQSLGIELYTIPPATPKANGMVERAQRSSREEHYACEPPSLDLNEERSALAAYVHHYNHTRPHQALAYQTPAEYAKARNLL